MTNTRLLEGAIARSGKTKKELAKILNLSEMGLYKKISAQTEFKGKEIAILRDVLSLSSSEMTEIFLTA